MINEELKAKELLYMQSIYEEIIHNLNLFLEKIGLSSDVVGINVIVKYMIQNGYLTNRELTRGLYSNGCYVEEKFIQLENSGLLVPYGCAVCRHIANFLYALYNSMGFENYQLLVYEPSYECVSDSDQLSLDILQGAVRYAFIHYGLEKSEGYEVPIIHKGIDFSFKYMEPNPDALIYGNHTLNVILDKNCHTHILDSTRNYIAGPSGNPDCLYLYHFVYEKLSYYTYLFLRYSECSRDNINPFSYEAFCLLNMYPYASLKEDFKKIREFEVYAQERKQDFEEFKRSNARNYERITESVLKLVRSLEK